MLPTTDQLLRVLLICLIGLSVVFLIYGVAGLVTRAAQ